MEEHAPGKDAKNKPSIGHSSLKGSFVGGITGAARNAARYIVRQGGTRWYNGVQILDKTAKTAKGLPKWFARIDYATPKNPQAHINVNRAVTGLKDPHIPISTTTANNAATAGTGLNYINKVAPVLTFAAVAYDGYQIWKNYQVDKEHGSTRNTRQKMITTAATWGGGYGGATGGAAIGTAFFPGIGTMIGAIVGGVAGGIGGSVASESVTDAAMDWCQYDIIHMECIICLNKFECRTFETGARSICDDCEKSCEATSTCLAYKNTCVDCGKILAENDGKLCRKCDRKKNGCGKCGWCGAESENLESVELEDGEVQLCETCQEVLLREVEAALRDSEAKTL